jgi:glycosyltransferase involved in cell wall biosynthesis
VATNKLFEYLAARRPVLVLGDESEAARIVTEAGAGIVTPSDDPAAIAEALRRLVAGEVRPPSVELDRFAWPSLAACFEEEIESAVRERARRT